MCCFEGDVLLFHFVRSPVYQWSTPPSVMSRLIALLPVCVEVLDDELLDYSLLPMCRAVHGRKGQSHAPLHAAT